MSKDFLGITWGRSEYVLWFPFLCIAVIILLYKLKKYYSACNLFARINFSFLSFKKQVCKAFLFFSGLSCLFLATLHPQWTKKEETVIQKGRDLFIALDISRSMLASDCTPNRLECARKKIKELLKHLNCERVGLILFSGVAFVQCPLTSDYSAFYMFLDQVDVELISSGTTALDQAIKETLVSFERIQTRKNKLLVLFSDGEDFSTNLSGIKKKAQEENLHIFTFGIGTQQGAPIPLFDVNGNPSGHQKNAEGKVVISRLNENILRTLSQDVGGMYLKSMEDDSDIHILVDSVQKYEKEELGDKTFLHMEQQYALFLLVSFICFACEWLL